MICVNFARINADWLPPILAGTGPREPVQRSRLEHGGGGFCAAVLKLRLPMLSPTVYEWKIKQ